MDYVINLSCPDQVGLVKLVASWLFDRGCNILDSDQFRDDSSNRFFMRVHFEGDVALPDLKTSFQDVANSCGMTWDVWPCTDLSKVCILVSKQDHCLLDLLYRARCAELPIDVDLIVSNHRSAYSIAAADDIDYLHLPIDDDNKREQEERLAHEIERRNIDFMILARYMQILSPEFCASMEGRIVNIHHSFLPSFKGAKPYHQAFEKGVKLIGATAHFVTSDLDEGPIIDQDVERVDHRKSVSDLVAVGRDVERVVLARAVKYVAEHRVMLNGGKTVVFG